MPQDKYDKKIVASTPIDGLEWRGNNVCCDNSGSLRILRNTDVAPEYLFTEKGGAHNGWLSVHLGQNDILTYIGDDRHELEGIFVDCRQGSQSLHTVFCCRFKPSPYVHLFIERGIAHAVFNKSNTAVRVESELYMSESNPDFDFLNDSINFSIEQDDYPVLMVNSLPLPPQVGEFILFGQQERLINTGSFDVVRSSVIVNGNRHQVVANIPSEVPKE